MAHATQQRPGPRTATGAREPMGAGSARLMALIRIGVGIMWLSNVSWKTPPDFGSDAGRGLYAYTNAAVKNPVFPPYSWVVEHAVLPNFHAFGWMVLLVEASLAAFLLLGLGTRLWGLIGAMQSLAIFLSVGNTPHEWPWSYFLMIMVNLTLFAVGAGRTWGLDAILRPLFAMRRGRVARLVEVVT